MLVAQAIDASASPTHAGGVKPDGGQVRGGESIAFEQLLALSTDGYLRRFTREIHRLVPGETSEPPNRENAHVDRLAVLQAEDAQAALGLRASSMNNTGPLAQRLGAQRAALDHADARSSANTDQHSDRYNERDATLRLWLADSRNAERAADFSLRGLKSAAHSVRSEARDSSQTEVARSPYGDSSGASAARGSSESSSASSNGLANSFGNSVHAPTTMVFRTAAAGSESAAGGRMARQMADALLARAVGASDRSESTAKLNPAVAPPADSSSAGKGRLFSSSSESASQNRPGGESQTDPAREAAFGKLLKSIRFSTGVRTSTARLYLNPAELGRMRVDVRLQDQRLYVEVRMQHDKTRELFASRVDELRQALERHGVTVERFELRSGLDDPTASGPREAFSSAWAPDRSGRRIASREPTAPDGQRRQDPFDDGQDESRDVRGVMSPQTAAGERRLDVHV